MKHQLSIKRVLTDGTIMNVLLTIIVYGSIYVNPLMWVSDYPPDIQEAVGPVDVPIAQKLIVGVLLLCIVVGVPLHSNAKLRQQNNGKLSFPAAFANSALIAFSFAVWDLLILDWLIFVTIQPDFVVIPGTEGLAGYKDYWFHFEVSFLGWAQWISILVAGLVLGGLSMIRLGGKRRSGETDEAYYVGNKARLLRDHRRLAAIGQGIMAARYELDFVAAVTRESLAEFEGLLPELPYIGGDQNPLTGNLVFSASALAFYQVMKRRGKTVEETGELLYRIMEAWIRRYPGFIRRLMGSYYLSKPSRRQSKKRAPLSQERRHAGDWVFEYVEGDGETFGWGRDYVECGIVKFLHSQGADELAPYLCLTDYALFGALGIELMRTMTLAEGCEKCDFRFKKGESPSGWPPPWLNTQEE
ncbi:MAG: L-2-amino-thiazoline-4-carboxylic acid hydrolase [Anaerolineae bacterium]|nr:L-2-amino-thiazoline-4-carboxylic acid hydrolase [Anaerolineae bacterium]